MVNGFSWFFHFSGKYLCKCPKTMKTACYNILIKEMEVMSMRIKR